MLSHIVLCAVAPCPQTVNCVQQLLLFYCCLPIVPHYQRIV